MLYHTIQKFSDTDDKIAKSVGIPLRNIRECILDLMESYEKSFDDVEDVKIRIGKVRKCRSIRISGGRESWFCHVQSDYPFHHQI